MSRPTLPGTIPGLLRRGSPCVRDDGMEVVVLHVYEHDRHVLVCSHGADDPERFACANDSVDLDLTDPTGRAHAAWWLAEHLGGATFVSWTSGQDMSDSQIENMRRAVLAVAGLEGAPASSVPA